MTALRQGLKIGTFFLLLSSLGLLMLTGGLLGLVGLHSILTYNKLYISLILLYLSFPFALWNFGKINVKNILKQKNRLLCSLEFSVGINIVIWTVFLISQLLFGTTTNPLLWFIATIKVIIILSIFSTFTIGLYIVKRTETAIKNMTNSTQ